MQNNETFLAKFKLHKFKLCHAVSHAIVTVVFEIKVTKKLKGFKIEVICKEI